VHPIAIHVLFKQIRVRPRARENHGPFLPYIVDQEKTAADVAFAKAASPAAELMIQLPGRQRLIIGNQKHHSWEHRCFVVPTWQTQPRCDRFEQTYLLFSLLMVPK
jgi:gentisate 1,2-dioxygenase